MKRALLAVVLLAVFAVAVALGPPAAAQRGDQLEQMRRGFTEQNDKRLAAEPFKGITAGPEAERGLFAVRSTGVSTEPVRRAALAFLDSLTPEQRARTRFAVDDLEWRKWANQDIYMRQGVSFLEMTEAQREKAFDLMRAALSAKGLKQTRDIMRLNHTLGELNDNNFDRYGQWRYHVTVMGEPSATEPWGWQFDGHHAVINYFVLGDQVVMTPLFAGSEPVIARSGEFKGTVILQDEQNRGLALINALPGPQRAKAILNAEKTGGSNLTEAFRDNVVLDYQGVPASELPAAQKKQLTDLIALHVGNMADGHARVKMEEVQRHLDRTTFAWIGKTEPDSVFYYRIHSPVILIEFDHQSPVGLRTPGGSTLPNREHIHVVVRTPNGNDYGKDLLRQHYAQHPH
jgi:hypothetical protein